MLNEVLPAVAAGKASLPSCPSESTLCRDMAPYGNFIVLAGVRKETAPGSAVNTYTEFAVQDRQQVRGTRQSIVT